MITRPSSARRGPDGLGAAPVLARGRAQPRLAWWATRLGALLGVVYLMLTEGYAATSGDRWIRADVAGEALRLGRVLAGLVSREPEVHALVAPMELQASRFPARTRPDGSPVLLADQDRTRCDRAQIGRGRAARADALGRSLPAVFGVRSFDSFPGAHETVTGDDVTAWILLRPATRR